MVRNLLSVLMFIITKKNVKKTPGDIKTQVTTIMEKINTTNGSWHRFKRLETWTSRLVL